LSELGESKEVKSRVRMNKVYVISKKESPLMGGKVVTFFKRGKIRFGGVIASNAVRPHITWEKRLLKFRGEEERGGEGEGRQRAGECLASHRRKGKTSEQSLTV